MTKPESKRSGMAIVTAKAAGAAAAAAAGEQWNNGSVDATVSPGCPEQGTPTRAKAARQSSRENLVRRDTECEVFDDGTNTFFW